MLPCRNGWHPFLVYTQRSYRRITEVNDEKEVVCSGKTMAPFIMGVMFWLIGIGVTFFITDFRHFTGSERRRHYLFHIMWNGRELFPSVLAQQKNYYDAG